MTTGRIVGEPIDQYHASGAIGSSMLSDLRRSPRYFFRRYVAKISPPERTPALDFGQALDCLLLEPGDWDKRFYLAKTHSKQLDDKGRICISHAEHAELTEMIAVIWQHPLAKFLLDHSVKQITFRHKIGKYYVQCRPDALREEPITIPPELAGQDDPLELPGFIMDVKTVADLKDIDGSGFRRNYNKFSYPEQAAYYQVIENLERKRPEPLPFFHLVTETSEPYDCMIFRPDESDIEAARNNAVLDLAKLRRHYETGIWPGNSRKIVTVSLYKARERNEE